MSAVASNNRAASTVFLLALLLVTINMCLASSVVPAANGRLLQQLPTISGGGLTSRLQALRVGVAEVSDQVKASLQGITLPLLTRDQLQQVGASLDAGQNQLRALVQNFLVDEPTLLAMPNVQATLGDLLSKLGVDLRTLVLQQLSAAPASGGCFRDLQKWLVTTIRDWTSELEGALSVPAGEPLTTQAQIVIAALRSIGDAVRQVDPCAPGLEALQRNGEGVLAAINSLAAGIKAQ